ncbi:MAG TPA: GNAT family protein [Ktedonobacterales bacterium]|nr:GNAT family protein [Ktedonobacterales bacterium]
MAYTFVPLRWRDALAAGRWHYPGAYAHYDFGLLEMLGIALAEQLLRLIGRGVYYSVLDERGRFIGLFTFEREGNVVTIGLGLRPSLTGQGLGLAFVEAGLAFAQARFRPARFRLDVATFNRRAYRVYERAGFRTTRAFERTMHGRRYAYLEMERPADCPGSGGGVAGAGRSPAT